MWVKGPKNWSKWSGVRLLDILGTFALYKSKKSIRVIIYGDLQEYMNLLGYFIGCTKGFEYGRGLKVD